MMDNKIKVAVIMPFKNSENTVAKAATSVLYQTGLRGGVEIVLLCVDDLSTDGSRDALSKVPVEFTRKLVILDGQGLGPAQARNVALNYIRVSGDFTHVAFCDSDDYWYSWHLGRSLSALDDMDCDLVYSNVDCENEHGKSLDILGIPNPPKFDFTLFVRGNYIFISSVVMDVKCISVGDFDPLSVPMEDWDYWLRIFAHHNIAHLDNRKPGIIYMWKSTGSYYTAEDSAAAKLRVQKKHNMMLAGRKIVISPWSAKLRGGRENPKNYPYWSDVVAGLKANGAWLVQIGIAGEPLIGCDEFRFNLTDEGLRSLLYECDTFLSVDSFLPHFAAHIGKKGVVIFGKSDPEIFGHSIHLNILKSREYLRPDQFRWWQDVEYDKSAFVDGNQIVASVIEMFNSAEIYKERS